jgi:hypothetical protein
MNNQKSEADNGERQRALSPATCSAMVCPVCGGPAKLQFTRMKGRPYIACDADRVKAILLQIHGDPRISPNADLSGAK